MTQRILTLVLLPLTVAWIAAAPLTAADEPQDKGVRRWLERMTKVDRWLVAGDWNPAERALGTLAEEMARLADGDNAPKALALALTYRAVANAGLGRGEEAVWYWQVAQNLDPELRGGALFPNYGAAGMFLEERPLRRPGEMPRHLTPAELASREDNTPRPPGPLSVPAPVAPPGLANRGWYSEYFEVEVLVDPDGRVKSPVVLRGEMPGKIYLGLEALRRWSFMPARSAGRPVAALLTLTDFTVPRSLAFAMAQDGRTRDVHQLLMAERWQEALAAAETGIDEALARAAAGSPEALGGLTALRALAEAGLGETEDALGSWQLARAFDRSLGWLELGAYGAAGRLLESPSASCLEAPESCGAVDLKRLEVFQPPRKIDAPAFSPTPAVLPAGETERIVVRLIVGADGRVREPQILTGHAEAAVYRALESLRDWRFAPAVVDGRPVAAVYELTIPLAPEATAAEVDRWRRRLRSIDERLRAGDGPAALPEAQDLVADIVAGAGRGGSDLLAQAVALQALAEAGDGRPGALLEAAGWHWQVAQNLAFELQYRPLSAYGPAGELLARQRLRPPSATAWPDPNSLPGDAPASLIVARQPRFPEGDVLDLAVVEVLIGAEGRPRSPVVLQGRAPGRLYTALEALREWRFEPRPSLRPERLTMPLGRLRSRSELRALDRKLGGHAHTRWKQVDEMLSVVFDHAERGADRAALGLWQLAQIRVPALALADLTPYGTAGELLGRHRFPAADRWPLLPPTHPAAGTGTPGTARATAGPLQVGGDVTKPTPIYIPQPQYSEEARTARIQGTVIVQVTIDANGLVRDLRLLKGLPMGLSEQALRAISRWRFKPATLDGLPVDVYYNLTVNFRLQ